MFRSRFPSKLPTDVSNNGSVDPNSIKKPIVENTPIKKSEPFVTKIEKTVEQVDAPILVTQYKFTVQTKVEPSNPPHAPTRFIGQQRRTSPPKEANPDHKVNAPTKVKQEKDNGVVNNTLDNKPTKIPVHDNGSSSDVDKRSIAVPDQKYGPTKKLGTPTNYGVINNKQDSPPIPVPNQTYGSPSKSYGVINEKRDKPTTLVRNNGYNSSPVQERPNEVNEFITQVQTEASRPMRPAFLSGNNWRGIGGSNGYGDYNNYNNKDLDKPSVDGIGYEPVVEPYVVGYNREGPRRKELNMPPTQGTQIYGPTNDIGEVLNILKEGPQPRYNGHIRDGYTGHIDGTEAATKYGGAPQPRYNGYIRDGYTGHIDSTEAQRRYGNANGNPNRRSGPSSNNMGTITSTEAAKKYGGAPV